MSFWTHDNIRAVTGGAWILRAPPPQAALTGVGIDSRTIAPGEAFLALRGERFDGHDFLPAANRAGSPLFIVEREVALPLDLASAISVLRVPDSLEALTRLATAYRRTLEGTRVIAVTGSNGKTTTTRLIHSVLATKLRGASSPKSFNNAIGVPLTILRASPSDQFLVCEVGVNAPGEMAGLAAIVAPDIAVITSIGRAHLEGLGDIDTVCREKATLLSFLQPGGCAIAPADAPPRLADYLKPVAQVVTFGRSEAADLRLTSVSHTALEAGALGLRFTVNGRQTFETPLLGEHNALNALAASAVGRRLGLDDSAIARGLLGVEAPEMRLSLRRVGDVEVLNDAYNANPDSMDAAVRTFSEVCSGAKRRIIVLGEMLEMGNAAAELHAALGRRVRETSALDALVAIGPSGQRVIEGFSEKPGSAVVFAAPSLSEEAIERILDLIEPGDAVLLKGSRGMGLERIEAALEERLAEAPLARR